MKPSCPDHPDVLFFQPRNGMGRYKGEGKKGRKRVSYMGKGLSLNSSNGNFYLGVSGPLHFFDVFPSRLRGKLEW